MERRADQALGPPPSPRPSGGPPLDPGQPQPQPPQQPLSAAPVKGKISVKTAGGSVIEVDADAYMAELKGEVRLPPFPHIITANL